MKKKYFKCWLLLLIVFFSQSSFASALDSIKNLGLNPIQADPIDFRLKDLDGSVKQLSEYKGKWIWLVFWATWCPSCKREMPGLESLYVEFKDKGLVVLGITTEAGNESAIKEYLKGANITFPILIDEDTSVSSNYKASSIPTMYLISPDYKVVALSGGYVDLDNERARSEVSKLLEYKEIPKEEFSSLASSSSPTPSSGGLSLPEELIPPDIKVLPMIESPMKNKISILTIEIGWKGDQSKYLIKVPNITLPSKVTLGKVTSTSSNNEGKSALRYHFELTFTDSGKYQIGPFELSYMPREAPDRERFTRASAIQIEVITSKIYIYIIVIFTIILIISVSIFVFNKRQKSAKIKKLESLKEDEQREKMRERYRNLKKMKLSGTETNYPEKLLELLYEVKKKYRPDENIEGDLRKFLEKVKYAGIKLTPSETRAYEKEVEELISFNQ